MKGLDIYICALECSLEQAPKVFQSICVDVALRVALSMINHLMVVIAFKAVIRTVLVGADRRTLQDVFPNVSLKLALASGGNDFRAFGVSPKF
jgi:hypothetical protein